MIQILNSQKTSHSPIMAKLWDDPHVCREYFVENVIALFYFSNSISFLLLR